MLFQTAQIGRSPFGILATRIRPAIAKRLLVASMACVTVWAIAADNSKEAAELRAFLVKLSVRQMRHKKEFTNPALLAGLWVFLSMLEIMGAYTPDSLKATAQQFLGKVV